MNKLEMNKFREELDLKMNADMEFRFYYDHVDVEKFFVNAPSYIKAKQLDLCFTPPSMRVVLPEKKVNKLFKDYKQFILKKGSIHKPTMIIKFPRDVNLERLIGMYRPRSYLTSTLYHLDIDIPQDYIEKED